MYFFDYGLDSDNKPPSILLKALQGSKLKMTGCEMFTFVRLFGVFAGDLASEDDEYWRLYTILHDILLICFSKVLPLSVTSVLEVLVKQHHDLYMKLTGLGLKPKSHILVHYNRRLFSVGTTWINEHSTTRGETQGPKSCG